MKAQTPSQLPRPATTTTKVKRYSAVWIGLRHGFPPVSPKQKKQSWRVIRWGTEYAATLVELATSDGFFVGILLPNGQALIEGDLFLFETRSEMLLARVERNYPVRYTCRLVRFKQPVSIGIVKFRWAHQDGLLTGKEGAFRITRNAPVAAQTEQEALERFGRMEPHTIQDIAGC